jgi:hypothetical protein
MEVDADDGDEAGGEDASVRSAVNSDRKLARFFKAQAKAMGNLDVPGAGRSLQRQIGEALAEAGRHEEEVRVLLQDKRNGLPDAVQLEKKPDFLKVLEGNLEKFEEEHRKILAKLATLHVEAEAKSEQILVQQDRIILVEAEVTEVFLRMAEGGKVVGSPILGGTAIPAAGVQPAGVSKEEFALVLASRAAKLQAAELALLEGAAAAQHAAKVTAAAAAAENLGRQDQLEEGSASSASTALATKMQAGKAAREKTEERSSPYPEVK